MTQTKTTLCPFCLQQKMRSPVDRKQGEFFTACRLPGGSVGPHRWDDIEEFNRAIAWGRQQFPAEYMEAPAAPTPAAALDGPISISDDTRKFIEKHAKQFIRSDAELKGILYSAIQTAEEAEAEIKRLASENASLLRGGRGGSGAAALRSDQIILDVPEWAEGIIQEQGDSEGKTGAEWVNEQFGTWLQTNFSQPEPRGR